MENPQREVRAAIIGTGRIGNSYDDEVTERRAAAWYQGENRHVGIYTIFPVNHADAYQSTAGYQLIAAANRTQDKLNAFGSRHGVRALYTDYRELLRQEKPDVVSVCTQSAEKAEIVIAAAEAGVKAIVLEKAVATSMLEADAMVQSCEARGVLLAVNYPYRFSPMTRAARQLIQEGSLGEISSITIHGGGGMVHVGTHMTDIMRFLVGDVVELDARIPNYEAETDRAAIGTVRFANGAAGFFDLTHGGQQNVEVHGQKGYISLSLLVGDGWFYGLEPTYPPEVNRPYPARLHAQPLGDCFHQVSLTQRLLMETYETLATGKPFISTGRDGAAALELSIACHASHLAAGPVQLPLQNRALRVQNR